VSSTVIQLPLMTGTYSMSYLDYILNPCSVIQINTALNSDSFGKLIRMKAETPVLVALGFFGLHILGEVVSFSATASADSAFNVSMLLMPPGIARPYLTSNGTLFGKSVFTSGKLLVMSDVASKYEVVHESNASFASYDAIERELQVLENDSVYSITMKYRKAFLLQGIRNFNHPDRKHDTARPLNHRVVYFTFPLTGDKTRNFNNPLGYCIFRDVDMSKQETTGREFLSYINPNSTSNLTLVGSNQGLLNNAYFHIPRETATMAAHASHFANQTLNVTTNDLPKPIDVFLKLVGTTAAGVSLGNMFRAFKAKVNPNTGVVPWGPTETARHIRTAINYTSLEGGQYDATGFTGQFSLARMNPSFCPARK